MAWSVGVEARGPAIPTQLVMVAGDPQWNQEKKRMQEGIPVGAGLMNVGCRYGKLLKGM